MQEDFLQYLWKYALFPTDLLVTAEGERVEILAPGQLNSDAGPDFLFARLRIGETLWVGHVEIHVKASDWFRHGHEKDPAYDPVILHAVYENDCVACRLSGGRIPTVSLPVKPAYINNYHRILSTLSPVPCGTGWKNLEPLQVEDWLVAIGVERMECKSNELLERLAQNRGGWDETLVQLFFRSFGFGINQEPFDRLGQSIPLSALRFAGTNLFRMEALLFGESGLIPEKRSEPYTRALATEFIFLKRKYNLSSLVNPGWKFLRMRPGNFPTVRLAQLASFLSAYPDRIGLVIPSLGMISQHELEQPVSSYWKSHYDFGRQWNQGGTTLGTEALNLFRINATIPFAACYANRHGHPDSRDRWVDLLEHLPPENNRITRVWTSFGYRVPNAFYSQAFLHLYMVYCRPRRCLTCRIGQQLIRQG